MKIENMTYMTHRGLNNALKEKNMLSVSKAKKNIAEMRATKRTLTTAIKHIHYSLMSASVKSFGQAFGVSNTDEAIGLMNQTKRQSADNKAKIYGLMTGQNAMTSEPSDDTDNDTDDDKTDTSNNDSDDE